MEFNGVEGCPKPKKLILPEPPKRKLRKHIFPILNGMIFGLIFAGIFSATLFVFAVPPTSKYDFSETLTPTCTPGTTNCSVVPPATYSFSANNFSGSGNFTTTGTTSTRTLQISGSSSGNVSFVAAATAGSVTYTLPSADGSSGQMLSTDGSGVLSWATAAGGGTPGGSDTQVQYNSGGSFAGSANLTYDGSKLIQSKTFTDAAALSGMLQVSLSGVDTTDIIATHWAASISADEKVASGKTNNANLLGLSLSAFRNYGTTSDSGTLAEVHGIDLKYGHYLSDITATPITNTIYGLKMEGDAYYGTIGTMYDLAVLGGGTVSPTTRYGLYISGLTGTTLYDIYANDATAKNYFAGNVGIGTTSPGGLLDVRKNQDAGSGIYISNLADLGNTSASAQFIAQAKDASGFMGAFPSDSSTVALRDRLGFGANSDAAGFALYAVSASQTIDFYAGSTTMSMKIDSNGRVGIANTSPGALLDIGTAGTTLGTMRLEGNTSGYVQLQTAAEAGSWTWTLPANDGDNGQVLTTNGSGVSSWATPTVYQSSDATLTALAGLTTAQGDLIYATGSDTFSVLNKSATATRYLANTGTSNNPAWAQIDLSNGVTGTLPLANGGTAANLTAVNGGIIYSGASALAISAAGSASQILQSGGAGAPTWSTATFPATATTTGAYMRADGTNWITSTLVLPNSATANRVAYATATNTWGDSANLIFNGTNLGIGATSPGALLDIGAVGTLGTMRLEGSTSGYVQIQPAVAAGSWTLTLPANDGDNGQVLTTNGSGVASWTASTGASFGTTTQIPYMNAGGTDFLYNAGLTFDGNTLGVISASAAQLKLSYNGSIYSTFTTDSHGSLNIATAGGDSGDIFLQPTGTGDVALLSDTGKMSFGGNGNTNNEDLKFDFETTANTSAITSTTGVSNITWTGNLTLGGNTTVGTLVTRVVTSAPTEADVNGSLVVDSGDGGRIYFRYGGAWHYVSQDAGFQIPNFETADPISGEEIKEGDFVLGMINNTLSDKALHGIWVKWDSVKAQLLAEARGELSKSGTWGAGSITDVKTETLLDRVTNVLTSLGISIKDGVTQITQLAVERFSANNARVQTLEMVDKATGEVYCTWLENGEMVKAKGECGSIEVASADAQPVGQSVQDAQQIINQAQQAASNALETTQQAQQAVQENAQQAVEQAVEKTTKEAVKEMKDQIKEEVKQELQAETPPAAPEEQPAPVEALPVKIPVQEVQPEPELNPAPEPNPVSEIIQEAGAGLLQSMWEFTKWIFGTSFDKISKIIPIGVKSATASILETDFQTILDGAKSAPGALLLPIQNIFK